MTETELAALDRAQFVAAFGDVFEHSAWIAEGAWKRAPFRSFADLHAAMADVLDAAGAEAAVQLVRAHPDLAGTAALAGEITADSRAEQKASGLARLTAGELARFTSLNDAYKATFEFPFVMAVRKSGWGTIAKLSSPGQSPKSRRSHSCAWRRSPQPGRAGISAARRRFGG